MSIPDLNDFSDTDIYITDDVFQASKYHYFNLPNIAWQRKICIELGIEFVAALPSCSLVQFEPHTIPEILYPIKPDGNGSIELFHTLYQVMKM